MYIVVSFFLFVNLFTFVFEIQCFQLFEVGGALKKVLSWFADMLSFEVCLDRKILVAPENFSFWRRDIINHSLVKDKKIRVVYTRKWFWNSLHSSTLLWTYLTTPISKPQVFFVWSLQQFWNWTCTMFFFPINWSPQCKVPLCQATVLTCELHTLKRVFISFPKYT